MESIKQPFWPRMMLIAACFFTMVLGILIGRLDGLMLYMPFIVIMGAFLVLLTFRFETLPFYLMISLLYFDSLFTIWSGPSPVFFSLALLSTLGLLVRMAIGRHQPVFKNLTTAIALALTLWATVSAFNSGGVAAIIGSARSFWFLLAFLLLIQNYVLRSEHIIQISWVLVISLSILGLFFFVNVTYQFIQSGFSLSGQQLHLLAARLIENSASVHIWMTMGIPFALFLLTLPNENKSLFRRILLLIFLSLLILGTLSMLSVNGTFGVLFTLTLWFLIIPRFPKKMKVLYLTLIFLFLVYLVIFSPFSDRISEQLSTVGSGEVHEFGTDRGLAWYIGWKAALEAPILGLGPNLDNILRFSQPYLTEEIIREKTFRGNEIIGVHPHNMYINASALIGFPGLLLYLAFISSILFPVGKRIIADYLDKFQTNDELRFFGYAIFVSLTVFLVQIMAVSAFIDKYLWLLLGVGITYLSLSSTKSS